jgi:DNA (cytosine-5)-methyltransferase 1
MAAVDSASSNLAKMVPLVDDALLGSSKRGPKPGLTFGRVARNGSRKDASRRRPVVIDLFAGAGGLSLGFEQAGFDVLAAVEYDPVHSAVHEFNFPLTEVVCADASKLTPERLLEAARLGARRHGRDDWDGEIDAIVGGPPCQGFSTMGKRLVDDTRNRLVFDFFRLVSALRPRYFVMENVPGMAAGGHSAILNNFIEEFNRHEYCAVPEVLSAADFGVPQLRRRLIVMGSRRGQSKVSHPEPRVNPVPKAPGARVAKPRNGLSKGPTVWQAIGDIPDLDRFPQLLKTDRILLSNRAVATMERKASEYAVAMREGDPEDLSYPREWDRTLLTSSARTLHTEVSVARFRETAPGDTEPVSRFYRLHPKGLCNTLRAGTGSERGAYTSPRPIHPKLPRVLSVREAARLHSIPDWFQLHRTKWHGFRQIGNAVAPRLGRCLGEAIVEALELQPAKPAKGLSLGDPGLLTITMSEAALYFGVNREEMPAPRRRQSSALEQAAA